MQKGYLNMHRYKAFLKVVEVGSFTKAAELMKNDVVSVGVYPEGTRNRDGSLLPFHDGVFIIARKADVPIVVATIDGTEKIPYNVNCGERVSPHLSKI